MLTRFTSFSGKGFTLIEVIVAISLIGIILVSLVSNLSIWTYEKTLRDELKGKFLYIEEVINNYFLSKEQFPCGTEQEIWEKLRYFGYKPAPPRGFSSFVVQCSGNFTDPDTVSVSIVASNVERRGDIRAKALWNLKNSLSDQNSTRFLVGSGVHRDDCVCQTEDCLLSCTTQNLVGTFYVYKKDWGR